MDSDSSDCRGCVLCREPCHQGSHITQTTVVSELTWEQSLTVADKQISLETLLREIMTPYVLFWTLPQVDYDYFVTIKDCQNFENITFTIPNCNRS